MDKKTAEYTVRVEYVSKYDDGSLIVDDIIDIGSFDNLQNAIACADGIEAEKYLNDKFDQIDITIIEYDENEDLVKEQNNYLRRIKEMNQ